MIIIKHALRYGNLLMSNVMFSIGDSLAILFAATPLWISINTKYHTDFRINFLHSVSYTNEYAEITKPKENVSAYIQIAPIEILCTRTKQKLRISRSFHVHASKVVHGSAEHMFIRFNSIDGSAYIKMKNNRLRMETMAANTTTTTAFAHCHTFMPVDVTQHSPRIVE